MVSELVKRWAAGFRDVLYTEPFEEHLAPVVALVAAVEEWDEACREAYVSRRLDEASAAMRAALRKVLDP